MVVKEGERLTSDLDPAYQTKPETTFRNPKFLIKGIQGNIRQRQGFTDLSGAFHQGHYLEPTVIIDSLKALLPYQTEPTKTTKRAERIIAKGSAPLYWGDRRSEISRRSALKTLMALSESRRSEIKRQYARSDISDGQFITILESIEGLRLSVMLELNPKKHSSIVRPDRKEIKIINSKGGE